MYNLPQLEQTANLLRQDVLQMLFTAGSGHSASALGLADVFSALYFYLLNIDPKKPDWNQRDRLLVSNGHVCPIWYASLARVGFFSKDKLKTLRQFGSPLQGHPHRNLLPSIENSSGSIGQGVSWAVGMAVAAQQKKQNYQIVCISSDGEQQEGQVWEAYLLASKYKLGNLIFIIDCNQIQIDGLISQVMPINPLRDKLKAFGLWVMEMDGHNLEDIIDTYLKAKEIKDQPVAILAYTIAGKGVSFMEADPKWHGKAPNKQELEKALKELKTKNES